MRGVALGAALLLPAAITIAADPMPLGPVIRVNPGQVEFPWESKVAMQPSGEFVVAWTHTGEYYPGDYAYPVFARGFDASGTPTSPIELVGPNNDPGYFRRSIAPDVAALGGGEFVVSWNQSDDSPAPDYSIQARRLSATGTPIGAPFIVSTVNYYEYRPAVEPTPAGGFVVVWDDFVEGGNYTNEIYGRRHDATGAPTGPVFPVKVDPSENQVTPDVAVNGAGGFVVVWAHDRSSPSELRGQRFDATNAPVGPEFTVTTDADIVPYSVVRRREVVAGAPSGSFVVVWRSDATGAVVAQRYDATATPVGTPMQVTADGSWEVGVAMEPDGSFAVAYSSFANPFPVQDDIRVRRFDATAGMFGPEIVVSTYTAGDQDEPWIATDGAGGFVVSWHGYHDDSPDAGVFARRLGTLDDVGISAVKLIVVDKLVASGKAKMVYVAKNDPGIAKGAGGDPALLSGAFDVVYTDQPASVAGSFVLPSPWRTAKDNVAKYVNSQAPGGVGQAKVAVVKDGITAKVVAKGLGDGPVLDPVAAGAPGPGGVTTAFTVVNGNDGTARRMCTRFSVADGSTLLFKEIGGGTGRKLIAKNGVPVPCP